MLGLTANPLPSDCTTALEASLRRNKYVYYPLSLLLWYHSSNLVSPRYRSLDVLDLRLTEMDDKVHASLRTLATKRTPPLRLIGVK
jgi:hypothetical protein